MTVFDDTKFRKNFDTYLKHLESGDIVQRYEEGKWKIYKVVSNDSHALVLEEKTDESLRSYWEGCTVWP